MAGFQDLRKLAEDGVIKLNKVRGKNKNPKTGNEVAEIANQMSQTIMSDYHSFVKDQRAAFLRRVDLAAEQLDKKIEEWTRVVNDMGDVAVSKCNESVEKAKQVQHECKILLSQTDDFFHSEKERIMNDIRMAEGSVKDKVIKVADELDAVNREAEKLVSEAVSKIESVDTAISNGRKYLSEVADEMKEVMKTDIKNNREKFIEELISYFIRNFFSIMWRWAKGLFKRAK